jgi:hypothetical protein
MKPTRTLVAVAGFALTLLVLTSCKDDDDQSGEIPYNKERARQHIIDTKTADAYRYWFGRTKDSIRRYMVDSNFLDKNFNMPVAEMFNRDAIAVLLNQKGADGIRIYLGKDSIGQVRLVLFPVDKNGKDIRTMLIDDRTITQKAAGQVSYGGPGQGVEVGQRCPDACGD